MLNARVVVVIVGVSLAIVRVVWRAHVRRDATPGPVAVSPTYQEAGTKASTFRGSPPAAATATPIASASSPGSAAGPTTGPSAATIETETLLNLIRSHGYRVTTHRVIGAVEMRATTLANRANPISARVDSTGRVDENDLRCAQQLAEKLGLQ